MTAFVVMRICIVGRGNNRHGQTRDIPIVTKLMDFILKMSGNEISMSVTVLFLGAVFMVIMVIVMRMMDLLLRRQ